MRNRLVPSNPVGRVGFVAIGVAVLLAGCDSGRAPTQHVGTVSSGLPLTPIPSPASPAPSQAFPSPSQVSPSRPVASKRTNLAACADADCEVEVRPGDRLKINSRFGVDAITVNSVSTEEVRLRIEGTSGGLDVEGENTSVQGSCTNGRCRDEGEMSLTTDMPGRINKVRLRLVKSDFSHAVLMLTPA
ncbi:hypothetical protein Misp02_22580 [Microtetraspora sp. NBRC 16547]|nr:hypothetical protein Misp02_22580 [Microtetraspora sp. NBRC 16547]